MSNALDIETIFDPHHIFLSLMLRTSLYLHLHAPDELAQYSKLCKDWSPSPLNCANLSNPMHQGSIYLMIFPGGNYPDNAYYPEMWIPTSPCPPIPNQKEISNFKDKALSSQSTTTPSLKAEAPQGRKPKLAVIFVWHYSGRIFTLEPLKYISLIIIRLCGTAVLPLGSVSDNTPTLISVVKMIQLLNMSNLVKLFNLYILSPVCSNKKRKLVSQLSSSYSSVSHAISIVLYQSRW